MRLASQCGSGSTTQSSSGWNIGTFVSKILACYDSLNNFFSVFSNLGLGFASGCIIIIAEIIYAKLTRPGRNFQNGGTILLLLTLSAILTTVTVTMIIQYYNNQYYNPIVDIKGRFQDLNPIIIEFIFFAIGGHFRIWVWPSSNSNSIFAMKKY